MEMKMENKFTGVPTPRLDLLCIKKVLDLKRTEWGWTETKGNRTSMSYDDSDSENDDIHNSENDDIHNSETVKSYDSVTPNPHHSETDNTHEYSEYQVEPMSIWNEHEIQVRAIWEIARNIIRREEAESEGEILTAIGNLAYLETDHFPLELFELCSGLSPETLSTLKTYSLIKINKGMIMTHSELLMRVIRKYNKSIEVEFLKNCLKILLEALKAADEETQVRDDWSYNWLEEDLFGHLLEKVWTKSLSYLSLVKKYNQVGKIVQENILRDIKRKNYLYKLAHFPTLPRGKNYFFNGFSKKRKIIVKIDLAEKIFELYRTILGDLKPIIFEMRVNQIELEISSEFMPSVVIQKVRELYILLDKYLGKHDYNKLPCGIHKLPSHLLQFALEDNIMLRRNMLMQETYCLSKSLYSSASISLQVSDMVDRLVDVIICCAELNQDSLILQFLRKFQTHQVPRFFSVCILIPNLDHLTNICFKLYKDRNRGSGVKILQTMFQISKQVFYSSVTNGMKFEIVKDPNITLNYMKLALESEEFDAILSAGEKFTEIFLTLMELGRPNETHYNRVIANEFDFREIVKIPNLLYQIATTNEWIDKGRTKYNFIQLSLNASFILNKCMHLNVDRLSECNRMNLTNLIKCLVEMNYVDKIVEFISNYEKCVGKGAVRPIFIRFPILSIPAMGNHVENTCGAQCMMEFLEIVLEIIKCHSDVKYLTVFETILVVSEKCYRLYKKCTPYQDMSTYKQKAKKILKVCQNIYRALTVTQSNGKVEHKIDD